MIRASMRSHRIVYELKFIYFVFCAFHRAVAMISLFPATHYVAYLDKESANYFLLSPLLSGYHELIICNHRKICPLPKTARLKYRFRSEIRPTPQSAK
jgi:hypothetical protein